MLLVLITCIYIFSQLYPQRQSLWAPARQRLWPMRTPVSKEDGYGSPVTRSYVPEKILWSFDLPCLISLSQMLSCPVSSRRRKTPTLASSGRRMARRSHLFILRAVSEVWGLSLSLSLLHIISPVKPFCAALWWNSLLGLKILKVFSLSTEAYASRAAIDGATVTLHSVTQKDTGVYRCEVTAKMDHVPLGEINVTLNVLGVLWGFWWDFTTSLVCHYFFASKTKDH